MLEVIFVTVCALVVDFGNGQHLFPPLPLGVPYTNNTVCKEHSEIFILKFKNMTLWAHEMWDATAKASTGVLRGSSFQMGDFEQCLTANAPFATQYCLVTMKINVPQISTRKDPLSLYYPPSMSIIERMAETEDKTQASRNFISAGWCVPASCTPADLEEAMRRYLQVIPSPVKGQNVTYEVTIPPLLCQSSLPQRMDALDVSFCILVVIVVVLTLGSTIYDFTQSKEPDEKEYKKSTFQKLALAFSAKRNFLDLTKSEDSNQALKILNGTRTFAILMIIMDHRFGTFTSSALLNYNYLEEQYRSPIACLLFHGDLFVDTFFILSGILVTYGLLNHLDKKAVNPGFFIVLRYIRLTPVYAFVIFYYATILNYTGAGPLFPLTTGQDSKDCRANWWTNLLYISNYVNADHMCMTHSWYLPCDFHYFIVAIGVCLLIRREKKLGFCCLALLTLLSILVPFVLTVVYQRPAMLLFYRDFLTAPKSHPDFLLTYSKSHTRATPYFMGMFAGYVYYKVKGKEHHLCRLKSHAITAASVVLIAVSLFTGAVFYDPYRPYSALGAGTYAALHRPAWALGTLGLLYATSFGHNPPLTAVLNWAPLQPLSRLVYGAYLAHIQLQLRSAGTFRSPHQLAYFTLISLALSDMVLAFFTAFLLYLGIEAPCRNIFKELLMPSRDVKKSVNNNELVSKRNESRDSNAVSGSSSSSRL